jgi:hypothetical protein
MAAHDGGARSQGGGRLRGEPILGLRAGRCSPKDPVHGGTEEAEVLTGVRLKWQQRKGVDWSGR